MPLQKKDGVSPLHVSAAVGHDEIIEMLVTSGAKLMQTNNVCSFPLSCFLKHVLFRKARGPLMLQEKGRRLDFC